MRTSVGQRRVSAAALLLPPPPARGATATTAATASAHTTGSSGRRRASQPRSADWVILKVAEPKTDDPDTVLHDTWYHIYDVWGSTYGDAPSKVLSNYRQALAARKPGDWTAASKYVGLMAHYYGDICNPLHTDQCDAEDRMHSSYETAAQKYTDGRERTRAG